MANTELDVDSLKAHVGRRQESSDVVTAAPANLLRLTFGRGEPELRAGDALPPGWQVGVCVNAGMALDYKPSCKPAAGTASGANADDSNEEYLNLLKQRLQK